MHPALRVFATVYIFLMIFISWVIIWLVQTITKALIFPFTTSDQQADICGHIFRRISFVFVDILNPFWRTTVLKSLPKMEKDGKYIVVLNHLSNADPWFAIRPILPHDCKWICKGSLFKVPFGGWALKNNGDLAIHFTAEKGGWGTKKGSVSALMDQARACVRRCQPIAVFPEGVRNPEPLGPLQEFKLGFFTLAVEEEATILPIAISGSETAWPRGDWKFNTASCFITCGEPIAAKGHTAQELCDKVKQTISDMRESHPDRQLLNKKD
jgi:1-acyl-sn-glycerol-3-phosphate acyltransferase